MSEGTANRRVVAARLVRRIPALVQHLQNGTLTLPALSLVKNVLSEANFEEVIAKIAGKSRQIQEHRARRARATANVAASEQPGGKGEPRAGAESALKAPIA